MVRVNSKVNYINPVLSNINSLETTDIIKVHSIEQIPTIETIRYIPRNLILKIVFEKEVQNKRDSIGQNLKKELVGFQVGVHTIDPEINIRKLITDQEIEDNQDFLEQCAKDYRQLGENLFFKLVEKLELELNVDFPLQTFNGLKNGKRSSGKVEGWNYYVHGFHCGFENIKTLQNIEVPLVFGLEFGDLDPYFFTNYIKSTPKYNPLPVDIFEDYADGARIIEKMISLGKFEKINSNVGEKFGVVVKDRKKVEIKSYLDLQKLYEEQNNKNRKLKFNFWKFFGLKKQ